MDLGGTIGLRLVPREAGRQRISHAFAGDMLLSDHYPSRQRLVHDLAEKRDARRDQVVGKVVVGIVQHGHAGSGAEKRHSRTGMVPEKAEILAGAHRELRLGARQARGIGCAGQAGGCLGVIGAGMEMVVNGNGALQAVRFGTLRDP